MNLQIRQRDLQKGSEKWDQTLISEEEVSFWDLMKTEIYTHVSNKDIGKIKSPLDSILSRKVVDEDG